MTGFLKLSLAALTVYATARCANSTPVSAQADSLGELWSLQPSPYGFGEWLIGDGERGVKKAFVPPGTRAVHDESDDHRGHWRQLIVERDLSIPPTKTILDAHEAYRMVPASRRGWVMEQSMRHSDVSIRSADLLESVAAMVTPMGSDFVVDGVLRVLGRNEKLGPVHVGRAARTMAAHVASTASQSFAPLAKIREASERASPVARSEDDEAERVVQDLGAASR